MEPAQGQAEVRGFWERFFAANPDARFDAEETFLPAIGYCSLGIQKNRDGKPWHLRGTTSSQLDGRCRKTVMSKDEPESPQ